MTLGSQLVLNQRYHFPERFPQFIKVRHSTLINWNFPSMILACECQKFAVSEFSQILRLLLEDIIYQSAHPFFARGGILRVDRKRQPDQSCLDLARPLKGLFA